MSGAFKLDSPLYSAFANALQRVLERSLPDQREKAVSIWLQIQDMPELGAIVRDEAKWPASPPDKGQTE